MITKEETTRKEKVEQILSSMIEAYSKKDFEGFISPYLQDERALSIGTGEDEWIVGPSNMRKFLERDFSQSGKIEASHEIRHLEVFSDTVCCAALVRASVEVEDGTFNIEARFSLTFKEIDGQMKIIQSHFSAPLSDQKEGDAFGSPEE